MGLVYSYIRFSDAKQAAGASAERQREYAKKWAEANGLTLDESLSMRDEGLSAYHQRHVKSGALGVFLAAIESGVVAAGSVLVVEGLDRLSRAQPIQAQGQLANIINHGITVVTASDNKVYSLESLQRNPMDLIHSLLVMIRAHEESATKSKRVRDAIRRQCQGWQNGTYTGLIRYGQTPGWLKIVDGKWQLIPERAEAIAMAVDLFLGGLGTGSIAKRLNESGLRPSNAMPTSAHLLRMLSNPALIGEKHLDLQTDRYILERYYPQVIDPAKFQRVGELLQAKTRQHVKGEIPSIITGLGITICGYCGAAMKAQNMSNRRKADGSMLDCDRRINCIRVNDGESCQVSGSCSIVPIERAIANYCSDMVNLTSLYSGDRAAAPRARLADLKSQLAIAETKLERLLDAMLESDAPPASFTKKAIELEVTRDQLKRDVMGAEAELANTVRAQITGQDETWRSLAHGIINLDYDARMRARNLIADTFERIVVYRKGVDPTDPTTDGIDVILFAKGGSGRHLKIDKRGRWLTAEECAQ